MIILLPTVLGQTPSPSAWKPVADLHAYGEEQLVGGTKRPFEVTIRGGVVAVEMSQAIDGHLSGVPRQELRGPDGVFTWLPSRPGWVLQRPTSTAADYTSLFTPPAFSPADLRKGPVWLQSQFGVKVQIDRPQKVAGRFCDVLHYSERSASVKTVWIDQETGLTLKMQEAAGEQVFVERTVTEIKLAPSENTLGSRPDKARLIRGVTSGGVLEHVDAPRDPKDYDGDIESARKGSKLGGGRWIMKLPPVPGFDYAVTEWREGLGSLAAQQQQQRQKGNGGNGGNADGDAVEVTFATGQLLLGSATQEKVVAVAAEQVIRDGLSLTFKMIDIDGPIYAKETAAGANAMLQSDFLDRETGDTISFIQLRNASLAAALKGLRLPSPLLSKDPQLGEVKTYEVTQPWKMTIVQWTSSSGQYAIASTRHSVKELLEMARKAGRN